MPSLSLNDGDLHYQCLGSESDSPVIMLHGLLIGNSATWYFGAASVLAKSHRVIVYDLRGHGMSSKSVQGYDLDTMTNDLRSLIESQKFSSKKVSLIGHSYGSLIALNFAKTFPELVEKLVLVESPLPPARGLQMDQFLGMNADDQVSALPKDLQEQMAKGSRQAKKLLERLSFLVTETELLENLKKEEDFTDADLQALEIPVQLIFGDSSQLSDVAYRLEKQLPQAKLDWLAGGHYLPSEKPQELSALIGGFMS